MKQEQIVASIGFAVNRSTWLLAQCWVDTCERGTDG
jgi:hypothetical protein